MITKFDKTTCKALNDEVAAAVQAIATKHGLTVAPAGGTIGIDGLDFTAKVSFKVTDTKTLDAVERASFAKWCDSFGVAADKYLSEFENKGIRYALIGFNVSSGKSPIKVRNLADGKVYGFPAGILTKIR